jgi:DNA-binding protein HU-beta
MNKTELITSVAQAAGVTKKDAERVVNAAFETITAQLAAGEKVQISGFGTFEVKERQARVGRNPQTKEAIEIPASKAPAFKPAKTLKDAVDK